MLQVFIGGLILVEGNGLLILFFVVVAVPQFEGQVCQFALPVALDFSRAHFSFEEGLAVDFLVELDGCVVVA